MRLSDCATAASVSSYHVPHIIPSYFRTPSLNLAPRYEPKSQALYLGYSSLGITESDSYMYGHEASHRHDHAAAVFTAPNNDHETPCKPVHLVD